MEKRITVEKNIEKTTPVKPLTPPSTVKEQRIIILIFVVLIILGVGTGYILSGNKKQSTIGTASMAGGNGKTFGINDTATFPDTTIGTVEKGGIDGEGTHTLIREGGPSQTACLVSSVLNLDDFVGKQVKVWSKTNDAKKCPWFMDVGKIEIQ